MEDKHDGGMVDQSEMAMVEVVVMEESGGGRVELKLLNAKSRLVLAANWRRPESGSVIGQRPDNIGKKRHKAAGLESGTGGNHVRPIGASV
jgi:hypothetical protein